MGGAHAAERQGCSFSRRRGQCRAIRHPDRSGVLRRMRVPALAGLLAVTSVAVAVGVRPAQAYSINPNGSWSDYAITGGAGGPFFSVSAQFEVPVAVCEPGNNSSWTAYWVGLQSSVGGGTIEQTGFYIPCFGGQVDYMGVHAGLKGGLIGIPEPMQPGDQVKASVSCSLNTCQQTVQDVTQNNWISTLVTNVPAGFSGNVYAAVAAESQHGGVNSTPVLVTNALVNSQPIGQFHPGADEQSLAAADGPVSIVPSPLDPTGTSFDFSWTGNPDTGRP